MWVGRENKMKSATAMHPFLFKYQIWTAHKWTNREVWLLFKVRKGVEFWWLIWNTIEISSLKIHGIFWKGSKECLFQTPVKKSMLQMWFILQTSIRIAMRDFPTYSLVDFCTPMFINEYTFLKHLDINLCLWGLYQEQYGINQCVLSEWIMEMNNCLECKDSLRNHIFFPSYLMKCLM